jgi:tetratricopeptide (TPR) repeat protein
MAVTLPFVLVLLDIWPLRRRPALWEKAPLFAMSAAASLLTLLAQRSTGTVVPLTRLPLADRLENSVVGYARYIEKALWPADLAMLYPIEKPSPAVVAIGVLILIGVTAAAVLGFKKRPYVLVGWLWFLGMLVPVIGLVQVGFQSIADRYTYVPLVGMSVAVIWTAGAIVERRPQLRQVAGAVAVLFTVILMVGAYRETRYWRDSVTLFEHTLAVTSGNYIIHNNLGIELQAAGRLDEAAAQYQQAVADAPEYKEALNNLGAILEYKGNKVEAIALHRRAVAADPNYANARFNLGHELFETGQTDEALVELTEALHQEPNSARGHAYMGALLIGKGDFEAARKHLEFSLRLTPGNADAQNNLCYVLQASGHPEQAVDACKAALKMRPNLVSAQFNLGKALAAAGQTDAAATVFSRMLTVNPNNTEARAALASIRPKR